MQHTFDKIMEKINCSNDIIITSHTAPDGDAVGSSLSLLLGLKKLKKNVRVVLQDDYQTNMLFLEKISFVEKYDEKGSYDCDLLICVDSASLERIGTVQKLIKNAPIVNIDHHISNHQYGAINYVEEISSTSEIVYNFLKYHNIEFDVNMAECLYLGLINDTGNFQHDNVTEHTFKMAAELKKLGARTSLIVREFCRTKSLAGLRLLGKALYEMKFDENKRLAYYFLPKNIMDKFQAEKWDTEGIVENLLSYRRAEVAVFLREDSFGKIKGSMRSKNKVDVNKIASIFGGGGHCKASGFYSELSPKEIITLILKKL